MSDNKQHRRSWFINRIKGTIYRKEKGKETGVFINSLEHAKYGYYIAVPTKRFQRPSQFGQLVSSYFHSFLKV